MGQESADMLAILKAGRIRLAAVAAMEAVQHLKFRTLEKMCKFPEMCLSVQICSNTHFKLSEYWFHLAVYIYISEIIENIYI